MELALNIAVKLGKRDFRRKVLPTSTLFIKFKLKMFEKPLNWLKTSLAWYNRTVSRDESNEDTDTSKAWNKFELMLGRRTTIFAAILCIVEVFLLSIGKSYCYDSAEYIERGDPLN